MLRVAKVITLILFAVAFIAPSVPVSAQIATVSNDYVAALMGQSGTVRVFEPTTATQTRVGRWIVYSVKGDPEILDDDNLPLMMVAEDGGPGWHHGYTTIRVDNTNEVFGDTNRGGWELQPYASDKATGNYVGLTGPYINSLWRISASNITVRFRMVLIRDQVRFEVVLQNEDTNAHSVGLRHCADITTNSITDTITYPYIPGRGIVMAETDLVGTQIPEYFEMFDNVDSPKVAIRNTLNMEDATPPDRVAIGLWQTLQANDWDYTPIPDRAVADYGWALWWEPVLLNPGESRTIVTYFGMAAASSSWTSKSGTVGSVPRQDPFCVAVQGPRTLRLNYDSSMPADAMLLANPFKIKAYVYNLYTGDTTLRNVQAHLTLPAGLELVNGTPTQEIASIPPESEALPVEWEVRATGEVTGELEYMVSVSGSSGLQKTVVRKIVVPSTGVTQFKAGWQMISAPFKFVDSRIEGALNLPSDTFNAFYWDSQQQEYKPVTTIAPGKGFWLNSAIERPRVSVSSGAAPLAGTESYTINLYAGWNQFGNPYVYHIPWGRVKVLGVAQDGLLTVEEAAARNLIRKTIYWWDTDAGEYKLSSDPFTNLMPWCGYWIKALQPCQLIIPAVNEIGSGISGTIARSRATAPAAADVAKNDGWRLKLVAKAGNAVDSASVVGVDSRASDAYDPSDVERPPSPGNYVSISFPHRDWGVNSGNYLSDIRRSASGTYTWDFEVACDMKNTDVVITWPTLSNVPKDYTLKMTDVDGNVTRFMSTTSSYRYNSGEGGVRRFKLVAEPRGSNRLSVSGLAINTTRAIGSASISYNLSADASTDVRIKSTSGKTVRNLAIGKGVTRGINSLSWNYRDEAGEPVPAGSYLLEVVATTPEGEVAKTIRPFLVAR